jgi:hypothetical protein
MTFQKIYKFVFNKSGKSLAILSLTFSLIVSVIYFTVDIRYGFPHFDTYQYSASVGPQAKGLRPVLLGLGELPGFVNGGELALPGVYWGKLCLFSLIPYSLLTDQALSFVWLILAAGLSALLLRRSGWGALVSFLCCGVMISDPTFLVNVAGTRPEPYAILLLLTGFYLIRQQHWCAALGGAFLLGLAGTSHVYAALLGPVIGLAGFLAMSGIETPGAWRRLLVVGCGILLGWFLLFVFWKVHPDAWKLFCTNLSVQRGFHNNPGRFFAYLGSFRLGAGWFVLLLLVLLPMASWWSWWKNGRGWIQTLNAVVISSLCLMIPVAYWLLKTDQYFYGVFIWPGLVAALSLCRIPHRAIHFALVFLLAAIFASSMARQASRGILGYQMRNVPSAYQQRLDWLKEKAAGAPRLFVFTRDWDISFHAGLSDVRFYTFPLPMTREVVSAFEELTFCDTPKGSILLFDRDYVETCPFNNGGSFDPRKTSGWELLETKTWHYDFSPSKPPARVWEIWRKKE